MTPQSLRWAALVLACGLSTFTARRVRADDDNATAATDATDAPTVVPTPPVQKASARQFKVDPFTDGAIIAGTGAFAATLDLVNSTGELRPQQISSSFKPSNLLAIDRFAVTQNIDGNAATFSNIGLFTGAAFAVADSVMSGVRENSAKTGLIDAAMYAETASVTLCITNLTKVAVRRPRPIAYIDAQAHKDDPNYSNSDTDSALSFFSGHAAFTASMSATATYLAFARSPHSVRPWITLGAGLALTTFVSIERVRAGAHFPTDVIAGAVAGAGVGVIVPHLHRTNEEQRVWIGFTPEQQRGGTVRLSLVL